MIDAERAKELRVWLESMKEDAVFESEKPEDYADLLAILDDYSALKAENERQERWAKRDVDTWKDNYISSQRRVVELEVELEKVKADFSETLKIRYDQQADLEKVRPLIEAVMADDSEPSFVEVQLRAHMNNAKLERLLCAALALREGEK